MIPVRHLRRLLVALPSARLGGAERHTADLARRLADRGLIVDLACEPALHAALGPRLGAGVRLRAAALDWEAPEAAARQAAEAARLVAALRPDAALLPLPWPAAAPGLLPALAAAGVPRLVLVHLAGPPRPMAQAGLEGAVLAAVSAPAAARAAAWWGVPETAFAILPNPAPRPAPIDRAVARATLRAGLGLPAEAPLVLFLGRLEWAKGADLLPGIAERVPATFVIAGEGRLRGELDAAAAADPAGRLRMLGHVADPAPWQAAADALLLPSRLEGAPLVFLEAAAHRCPVVASAAALEAFGAAAPDLAWIADGADPAGFAGALTARFADPAGTARRVAAAAALAGRRTPEASLAATLGLLRAAMSGAGTLRAA